MTPETIIAVAILVSLLIVGPAGYCWRDLRER
jgi:hypothetical protein